MHRRSLLGVLAGTLTAGFAGCTGLGNASEKPRADSATPTDPVETDENGRESTDDGNSDDDQPTTDHDSLVVPGKAGDDNAEIQPHTVRIHNTIDVCRDIGLVLVPNDSERPLGEVSARFNIPAGDAVDVELQRPATYTVTVTVEGTIVTEFTLDSSWFDCNSSTTNVELGANGAVDRTETTTLLACTDVTVEKPDDSE